ncbi:MAG: sigma-70 family RNA polymerase sigma factor [Bacteroidales bacterium]|nr:sigma-70 family RNA polymerase sigma factor [Bacteroidales bacterium]
MNPPFSYRAISRELVVAICEGNQSAFEAFYMMEYNNLLHFANAYIKDDKVAEDIAQETLIKLWQTRENLNPDGNIRALAFTIAKNMSLDFLRKKNDAMSLDACLYLEDNSLDVMINTLDLDKLVKKTFMSLPEKVRQTFLLSRHNRLTNKDIAEREHVSIKAIEYRISSALKVFRKQLLKDS